MALYSCFEAMVRTDTVALHLYFEVRFCKGTIAATNIKHSFCLLLHFSTVTMADCTFNLAERLKCKLEEKDALGKFCEKYKMG